MLETGWNRDDRVLQVNSFFFRKAMAHELVQEWAVSSPRHQLSYNIPLFRDGRTGLGDAMLSYRYQVAGDPGSRVGVAPRLSLILPTRSARFGERSSGLQLSVPLSVSITPRLTSHTNVAVTWYRDREAGEVNAAQSVAFAVTGRMAVAVDASYTRCNEGSQVLVVRPGVQFTIDGPRGLQISPGVAFPNGGGVLFLIALEQPIP